MKIHVMSDIHDDICKEGKKSPGYDVPDVGADVIAIAGDIEGRLSTQGRLYLERTRERLGKPLVVVAGNHDYWRGSIDREVERTRERLEAGGIHILDGDAVVLGGVRFVGATLWTDYRITGNEELALAGCGRVMNDFRLVRRGKGDERRALHPAYVQGIHMRHRGFIADKLGESFDGPTVVVTHHAPAPQSLLGGRIDLEDPDHSDAAYASDLQELIKAGRPDLWIHGHVHNARDYMVEATRIICNPRGYSDLDPSTGFDRRLVVEV